MRPSDFERRYIRGRSRTKRPMKATRCLHCIENEAFKVMAPYEAEDHRVNGPRLFRATFLFSMT